MKNRNWLTVPAALVVIAAASAPAFCQTLKVGDKAPAIKVSKWVKGTPLAAFEPGKLYVVEFWATWCGPCKTSIPHLTELAHKYAGKVTFAGVSVWERGDDIPGLVNKFVTDMGDKMDYNVALDDADKTMAKTWMTAAMQNGIPSSFIVDGSGAIVWIGHPMSLDQPLEQVVAGKFDLEKSKQAFLKDIEADKKRAESSRKLTEARKLYADGKKAEAMAAIEALAKETPTFRATANITKLQWLMADDPAAGRNLVDQRVAAAKVATDSQELLSYAQTVANNPKYATPENLPTARKAAEAAAKLTKNADPWVLHNLAGIISKQGEKDKAIVTQEQAIAAMAKSRYAGNAQLQKILEDQLKAFKGG